MNIHKGHRERMQKEFLARPETFPDHKVLEILLYATTAQGDTNPLAHELLNRFGSMAGVLDASYEELIQLEGIGPKAAMLFKSCKEISRHYLIARTSISQIINTARDAFHVLWPHFFGATCETAFVLCMDGKKKLLGVRMVGSGTADSVHISARSVAMAAMSFNCTRLILAHNHVSGLAFPSPEDRLVTKFLTDAMVPLEIQLDDHLIFVDDDMVSMRESGMLAF